MSSSYANRDPKYNVKIMRSLYKCTRRILCTLPLGGDDASSWMFYIDSQWWKSFFRLYSCWDQHRRGHVLGVLQFPLVFVQFSALSRWINLVVMQCRKWSTRSMLRGLPNSDKKNSFHREKNHTTTHCVVQIEICVLIWRF
jgi:hypothetical protein